MRRPPRPPMGPPGMGPPGLGPVPMRPRGPLPPRPLGPRGPLGTVTIPPMVGPGMGPRPGVGPHGPVSSVTNSCDPASMDSRLFVGNLNTIALNKEAVEAIFSRYGVVLGISMHKGYAFVQFSHPDEARRAGASEDGKHYAGQPIDINIVSQPKNRNALKRAASGKPSNDTSTKKPRSEAPNTNQSLQRTLVTLSAGNTDKRKAAATLAVKRALATVTKKNVKPSVPVINKPSSTPVSKPSPTTLPVSTGTKTPAASSQNAVSNADKSVSDELLEVEKERLQLEREHLEVLKSLLEVERERLEIERQRLKEYEDVQSKDGEQENDIHLKTEVDLADLDEDTELLS